MARYPDQAPPTAMTPLDGVLPVIKPVGWTSHDVVARVRNVFRLRKVGHGGTLDPMATGLLLLLLGRGTKLSQHIMNGDKVYEGVFCLGRATDTQDIAGKVLSETDPSGVTEAALREAMAARTGDIMQIPPMVSAVKKDGVPLYKLARKGKTVEREARLIHVYSFSLLDYTLPRVRFRLQCTKGTYVRTLCAEIGEELGCGAYLEALTRVRSGAFDLSEARPLEDVLRLSREQLAEGILTLHEVLRREQG